METFFLAQNTEPDVFKALQNRYIHMMQGPVHGTSLLKMPLVLLLFFVLHTVDKELSGSLVVCSSVWDVGSSTYTK